MGFFGRLLGRKSESEASSASSSESRPSLRRLLGVSEERPGPEGARIFGVVAPGLVNMGVAELLYGDRLMISAAELDNAIRGVLPEAIVSVHEGGLVVAQFPRLIRRFGEQDAPAMVIVEAGGFRPVRQGEAKSEEELGDEIVLAPFGAENRNAPEYQARRARGESATFGVRVFEKNWPLPGALRLELLARVVGAVAKVATPSILYWRSAQRLIEPEPFLSLLSPFNLDDLVPLVTSVRQVRVSNGEAKEFVADSIGLFDFGLPDVQLHYRDLDTGHAAMTVLATAHTVWKRGLFAKDGETLSGVPGFPAFRLRHEEPILEPKGRVVLDLDPGEPHAGGARARGPWTGTPQ